MVPQPNVHLGKKSFNLLGAGMVVVFMVLICYRAPDFPTDGLDPSWKAATHYAFVKGMTFGVDFAFTSGPLAFLYTNYFDRSLLPLMLFTMLAQAVSLSAACWFANDRRISIVLLCVGALLALPLTPDAIYFTTAFSLFLLALNDRAPKWMVQVLVLAYALPALAKFSFLLVGFALFGLADVARWFEQKSFPHYVTSFLLGCFVGYWAAGQPPNAFPEFLLNSLDVALGYSKAMSNFGLSVEVFVLVATVCLCVAVYGASALTGSPKARNRQLFRVLGFAGFMFVVFKSAAIRQGHDTAAWQALILSVALLAGQMADRHLSRVLAAGGAVAAILVAAFCLPPYVFGRPGYLSLRSEALSTQIAGIRQLLSPGDALKEFEARNEEALRALANAAPQGLTGTVGSVPWDFSEVIAAGYDFRPQPSLQSYSSYTSRLRRKDKAYFAGPERPDNLLFSLISIDGRYPTMDMGPSLLEILAHYDPVSVWKGGLVLRGRTTPRRIEWKQAERIPARIGEWVDVRSETGLSFIKAALRTRLAGHIISFAFKQPHLWLDIRFSNGRTVSHRFIPQLAETGFALVPLEVGAHELFQVSYGEEQDRARPVAIRLRPMNESSSIAYGTEFDWEQRAFLFTGPPEHPFTIKDKPVLSALLNAKVEKTAGHKSIPDGYFAHSGTRLVTEIELTGELRGTFGFLDTALRVGKPGPVRFSIRARHRDGREAALFERVLDPMTRPEDRGRQTFILSVPADTAQPVELVFETSPTTDAAGWGWTYWGDVSAQTH
ncbi:hypothetical protein AB4097_19605 [Microvirga sp. 2MCAF35]|uniref:hypothetical protein n=1 Tax=Microvirga sp. 2MCAF35 TaxID=3232987 RepID=UPI003F9CE035